MKNSCLPLLLLLLSFNTYAQDSLSRVSTRLVLDFPLLELPHLRYAADMRYNKRLDKLSGGKTNPTANDYLSGFESLSMQQALAITKNLHSTNYYLNNKLWNKWIKPDTNKKEILNRMAAHLTSGVIDYALAYYLMVFGPVWLHEEFHRNGITHNCIASHNDTYYRLKGGTPPSGSISKVKDEDLIRWKRENPQDMIRSFAAGIEAQYELVRGMRKDNFFQKTNYANIAMNILITKQAVDYVNQFKLKDYDESIDRANRHEPTIDVRDFVGWDFTAWVYDLFRPTEPYAVRGEHPYGPGIHRDIKCADLTQEEDDYLSKMGNLQYFNYLAPAMIGINRIKLNPNTYFSFAGRHILTSFGYDLGADFFIDKGGSQWFIGLHGYQNKNRFYPGIEIEKPTFSKYGSSGAVNIKARAMAWLQPQDQLFYTDKATPGGLLQIRTDFGMNKKINWYTELEAKTSGWVAGNPYLSGNVTVRSGLAVRFGGK